MFDLPMIGAHLISHATSLCSIGYGRYRTARIQDVEEGGMRERKGGKVWTDGTKPKEERWNDQERMQEPEGGGTSIEEAEELVTKKSDGKRPNRGGDKDY